MADEVEPRWAALWADYERRAPAEKAEAARRLDALEGRGPAVPARTLRNWRAQVRGVPRAHWLAALVPARRGRPIAADCDPRAWDMLVSDWLRPEQPCVAACLRRLREAAAREGWGPIPSDRTLRRRLETQVPRAVKVAAREGLRAAARLIPAQRRSRAQLAALEGVGADGHKLDLLVIPPGGGDPVRPVLLALQDLASGKILAHRLGLTESWHLVRLAFLDLLEKWGVPGAVWLDNGRGFAAKWLTGGNPYRFRFKLRPDEPAGLLTRLGVTVHFSTPYHGQAKPIERAFRDLAEEISRHPAAAGAYTGNRPDRKPENRGERPLAWEECRRLVAEGIARHNARPGRRGGVCAGRSFDQTFADLWAQAVVARPTAAQLRLFRLAAERVTARAPAGEIEIAGARWWHPELVARAGQRLTVRFDPDALSRPAAVYDADDRLICEAEAVEGVPFDSLEAARARAREAARWRRQVRAGLAAERRLAAAEVARLAGPAAPPAPPTAEVVPEPAALRLVAACGGRGARLDGFSAGLRLLEAGVISFRRRE